MTVATEAPSPEDPEKSEGVKQPKPVSADKSAAIPGTSPVDRTPESADSVPDIVAQMMKAKSFDIGQQKVDDFRAEAQRTVNRIINFQFGKPGGTSTGFALVTKRSSQIQLNAIVRKLGKTTKFARPTPEFVEPELSDFLETIHLVPGIDVTISPPSGICMPFRITTWDGYTAIFDALNKLADDKEVLFLKYVRGGAGNEAGTYKVEVSTMEPQHRVLWQNAQWPTAEDAPNLVPYVPFDELLAESFILRRAWAAVLKRKGMTQ